MYNIGAGSKDISPMNWGKYNDENTPDYCTGGFILPIILLIYLLIMLRRASYDYSS